MNNVKNIEGKCSGCGACFAICPKNAIKYYLNEDGFYTVDIQKEKCINCGLCTKVCLKNINTNNLNEIKKGKLIAARTKNEEILSSCTSGAIAYEIGNYGLENNYKIVGVIYDEKENIAKTIITNNKEEFEKMKSSKYIQSRSDEAIKQVIQLAKKNPEEKFIIFGTPCQIYGYKMAIKQMNIKNEIIFIDLFCHGVPSYLVWNKYLNEIKDKEKIKQVSFRDKKYGWHNFVIKIEKDKKIEYKKAERCNFYKMFFDNVLLNESCSNCEVRKHKSYADIRLGDFWGKKYSLDTKGVSAVVILTEKGKELINNINFKIDIISDNESMEECLKYQSTKDYKESYNRHELLEEIKTEKSLKYIIKKYRKNFSSKQLLKLRMKTLISYLPANVKIKIASKVK